VPSARRIVESSDAARQWFVVVPPGLHSQYRSCAYVLELYPSNRAGLEVAAVTAARSLGASLVSPPLQDAEDHATTTAMAATCSTSHLASATDLPALYASVLGSSGPTYAVRVAPVSSWPCHPGRPAG
jgi:hypothetical protein